VARIKKLVFNLKQNTIILKHCIWCRKTEEESPFKRLAHTIPQALGGKDTCINVCDTCNHYFGIHFQGSPSIETIIKETFNISRVRLLDTDRNIGKNKAIAKFSSIYFDVDLKNHKIELKLSYRLRKSFQEKKLGDKLRKVCTKFSLKKLRGKNLMDITCSMILSVNFQDMI
jgi:hypothetical protein